MTTRRAFIGTLTGLVAAPLAATAQQAEKAYRIGFMGTYTTSDGRTFSDFKKTEAAARALRVTLLPAVVNSPEQFADAFAAVTRERAQGLLVAVTGLTFLHRQSIGEFAARNRLPAIYAWREAVEAGGLMSYGISLTDIYRRAATYVDKILRGAKPADLPVEQPTKFELVINRASRES